jgi:glycosyltransferase involved in cell wall biosynthesis
VSHVALVIPGINRIAGAERQLIQLAKGLARRGWRVSVVALSDSGGDEADGLVKAGVAFTTLGMRKGVADPRGWIRFHRWLRKERPDVIHAHLPHATWLARWSRLAAPVRVVMDTLHSSSTGSLGRKLGYRWSDWLTDKVTAVSRGVADAHQQARMVSAAKLTIVPNGVDVNRWRPDAVKREALRREVLEDHEFLWLAAGRLDPVKDYPTLLQAMVEVPEQACLVIAGAGQLEKELRRFANELGLERRVRFLLFEPNVCRWMQAADAFVLSSRWEGLPMALMEAAACELPAVATDVPGTREVLMDGQTGLLVSAGNALDLAGAMTCMMQVSPEERQAMGAKARQLVIERFSLEAVLDRWEELYSELMEPNPNPSRWHVKDQ